MRGLDPGDRFPDLTAGRPEGGSVHLPGLVQGRWWGIVLVYRGNW